MAFYITRRNAASDGGSALTIFLTRVTNEWELVISYVKVGRETDLSRLPYSTPRSHKRAANFFLLPLIGPPVPIALCEVLTSQALIWNWIFLFV